MVFRGHYLGIALVGLGMHVFDSQELAAGQFAHAKDRERHMSDMFGVSRAALVGEQRTIGAHNLAQATLSVADAAITKERDAQETDNHNYRAALTSGSERLRVAVRGQYSSPEAALELSAPLAGAMVAPPSQTSTQHLRSAFSRSSETTSLKSIK